MHPYTEYCLHSLVAQCGDLKCSHVFQVKNITSTPALHPTPTNTSFNTIFWMLMLSCLKEFRAHQFPEEKGKRSKLLSRIFPVRSEHMCQISFLTIHPSPLHHASPCICALAVTLNPLENFNSCLKLSNFIHHILSAYAILPCLYN